MMNDGKKMKAADIIKNILDKQNLTTKDLLNESIRRGVTKSNFYVQLKSLREKGDITRRKDMSKQIDTWILVDDTIKADCDEIRLCLNEIQSGNERLRRIGLNELVFLCKTKVVTHDPQVHLLFKKAFTNQSYHDIQREFLDAFHFIIARTLSDCNNQMLEKLLQESHDALKQLIQSGTAPVKKRALSLLALTQDTDVLSTAYDLIKNSDEKEYSVLQETIMEIFRSKSPREQVMIKRELFRIATAGSSTEDAITRALNLLERLTPREKNRYA